MKYRNYEEYLQSRNSYSKETCKAKHSNNKGCNSGVKCLVNDTFRGSNILLLTGGGNVAGGEVVLFNNNIISVKEPLAGIAFVNDKSVDLIVPI